MATVKQRAAVKKVLNGSTITRAMSEVGYAATTAGTTGKLTRSKGWAELVEKHISDEALAKVHKEGLGATTYFNKIVDRDSKGAPVYEMTEIADFGVRHKYLESGYKLKGRYSEQQNNRSLIVIIAGQSGERYGIHTSSEPR